MYRTQTLCCFLDLALAKRFGYLCLLWIDHPCTEPLPVINRLFYLQHFRVLLLSPLSFGTTVTVRVVSLCVCVCVCVLWQRAISAMCVCVCVCVCVVCVCVCVCVCACVSSVKVSSCISGNILVCIDKKYLYHVACVTRYNIDR